MYVKDIGLEDTGKCHNCARHNCVNFSEIPKQNFHQKFERFILNSLFFVKKESILGWIFDFSGCFGAWLGPAASSTSIISSSSFSFSSSLLSSSSTSKVSSLWISSASSSAASDALMKFLKQKKNFNLTSRLENRGRPVRFQQDAITFRGHSIVNFRKLLTPSPRDGEDFCCWKRKRVNHSRYFCFKLAKSEMSQEGGASQFPFESLCSLVRRARWNSQSSLWI